MSVEFHIYAVMSQDNANTKQNGICYLGGDTDRKIWKCHKCTFDNIIF